VEVDVALQRVLVAAQEALDGLDLDLRGRGWALVRIGALVGAGAGLTPVELPVAVGVGSHARVVAVGRAGLSPHSVGGPGVVVAVGVQHGGEVHIEVVQNGAGRVGVTAHQGVSHVGDHTNSNPLTSVKSTVEPEGRLVGRSVGRQLQNLDVFAAVGLADDGGAAQAGETGGQSVEVVKHVLVLVIVLQEGGVLALQHLLLGLEDLLHVLNHRPASHAVHALEECLHGDFLIRRAGDIDEIANAPWLSPVVPVRIAQLDNLRERNSKIKKYMYEISVQRDICYLSIRGRDTSADLVSLVGHALLRQRNNSQNRQQYNEVH
jgi:hypothetical protein